MKRKGLTHGRNRKPSKGGSDGGMVRSFLFAMGSGWMEEVWE